MMIITCGRKNNVNCLARDLALRFDDLCANGANSTTSLRALMLANERTERTVYILIGLGGSGKTYQANKKKDINALNNVKTTIISANSYFYCPDGKYRFDSERLDHYHKLAFMEYLSALDKRDPVVIVDNTNIFARHRIPYLDAAADAYYKWHHVLVGGFDHDFAEFCQQRSNHGLDSSYLKKMADLYEPPSETPSIIPKEECGWNPNWKFKMLLNTKIAPSNAGKCRLCKQIVGSSNKNADDVCTVCEIETSKNVVVTGKKPVVQQIAQGYFWGRGAT